MEEHQNTRSTGSTTLGNPPVLQTHCLTLPNKHRYDPAIPSSDQDGQPWLVQRKWITIDPIFETTNTSLACNFPGDPAVSSIPINAGDNITAVYYFWLHTVGPMVLWMADCGVSCQKFNPSEAKWFKIAERGLLTGTVREGMWGQRDFQHWDGTPDLWTESIPRGLKAGNYLIRHEIIALHIAHRPQFYPQCAHLVVGGKGKEVPGKEFLTSIPGVWDMSRGLSFFVRWRSLGKEGEKC